MKVSCLARAAAALTVLTPAAAANLRSRAHALANPLGKVLELMDSLAAKVEKDGENEAKAFHEYTEWCDETAQNTANAIKTGTSEKAKLEAKIDELTSKAAAAETNIAKLAGSISKSEADLNSSTVIRKTENTDFVTSEKELMESLDSVSRAIGVLEKEMAKGGTTLAQIKSSSGMTNAVAALGAILDASAVATDDRNRLLALVQSQQGATADDSDSELGAPAASVYESKSGGIQELLEDMKEKAEGQLSELRKAEANNKHNFGMLKQSTEDQLGAFNKDLESNKADKAAALESKASSEGELQVTTKDLENAKAELETARGTCMQTAADHEATVAARKAELKVIAEAQKILQDTSSGAVGQTYKFVQLASTKREQPRVVSMIKQLARREHSAALAQLTQRVSTVMRLDAQSGEDPFVKVKGLLQDMIEKLSREAGEEASEKAYCDEQMAKTEEKKGELEEDTSKLTAKTDQAVSKSAELKESIKELESELAALAKEQAEMDKIRQEAHEDYTVAKADLEQGLTGVRGALRVLRDYYAADSEAALLQDDSQFGAFMQQPPLPEKHTKSTGAGSSIIGILEVCESDFATNLAKEETQEADSLADYEKITQENAITNTAKTQDSKYKSQEVKSLDKTIGELSSDHDTASSELSAVLEYYSKIKERCVAKPETYEERKARREAEIAGLKEALTVLSEDSASFVQRRKRRTHFRGALTATN